MSPQPLVSIVIPCYNRENYIQQAVDSALSQTYSNIEVIVVDDGSKDNSLGVLSNYGDKIQVISQSNKGVSAARNAGFYASKGEFIIFLDSDDWLSNDIVEHHILTAEKWPDADIYCADSRGVEEDGSLSPILKSSWPDQPGTPLELFLLYPPPFPACEMYRAETVRRLGCYDENMKGFADSVLRLNIILSKGKVVRTEGGHAVYRPVANSITKSGKLHYFAIKLINKLKKHPNVKQDPFLRKLIKLRLLRHRLRRWNNVISYHLKPNFKSFLKLLYHLAKTIKMDPGFVKFIVFDQPWKRKSEDIF